MIPYGRQDISEQDIEAVVAVLRSDFLTQGPVVATFEQTVADYCGARHACAVSSATAALHIACLALDVGPGDLVWTTPITFVASANCARYCGADVDFVDIDPRDNNLSVAALAEKLKTARNAGRLPKVVIPVDLSGHPCDLPAIHALAQEYGFRIIDDASHAIGASLHGERVGRGRHCDITVFSFHPVKVITTAEGGMATTNDDQLAARLRRLRSHGITREPGDMTQTPEGPWYYEQLDLGFNYRMTDVAAALGNSQIRRLDAFVDRRHALADIYDAAFESLPLTLPPRIENVRSAWHLYVVRLRLSEIRLAHREVFESLRASGIGVQLHYIPVYRQPYYRRLGFTTGAWPEAERYYAQAISLPMYAGLTEAAQRQVIDAVERAIA